MIKKCFLTFSSLAFVAGFMAQPCQTMDRWEAQAFKRKYQPTYNHQYNEPTLKKPRQQAQPSEITRLSTPEGHRKYLQNAISCATKSILITSHGVDCQAFEDGNLYHLLIDSIERGVKVYVYNIDSKDTDNKTFNFFEKYGIAYDVAYTHAKLLAVDNKMVAIGSYNWLSKSNTWENATLCLSGKECAEFVTFLWEDLKYYRNLQFGNIKQIKLYERNPENQAISFWELGSSTVNYLHTLDSHQVFITEAFQDAKNSLVFCAPFINGKSGYQADFEKKLLRETISRDVHIYFVCRAEDPNLTSFKNYLGDLLKSPFMHVLSLSDIHLKTVVIDDVRIAEGSFNWLSASRDEASDHHNHEVTLMVEGDLSRKFIQDFYQSPVGQEIIKARPVQKPQPNKFQTRPNNIVQQNFINSAGAYAANRQNISSHAQRRVRWLALDWKVSAKGNTYINTSKEDGGGQSRNIVVIKSGHNTYSAIVDKMSLNQWYNSEDQAKLAAFDFIWKK